MIRWLSSWPVVFVAFLVAGSGLQAASYRLLNGDVLSGEPISFDARGLIVRQADSTFSARAAWTNFTAEALKELSALPKAKLFVEPYLELEEEAVVEKQRVEIKPNAVPRLPRLDAEAGMSSIFSSPITVSLFVLLYLANLYAGFEISVFRNYPALLVVGVAAVLPVIGPIIFLCIPTRLNRVPGETYEVPLEEMATGEVYADGVAHVATEAMPAATPAVPTMAPPTVYVRGQTTFNRRFFETKLPGFLRMVPSDAEKDMVVFIKSSRGEHFGNRISRITPNDLYLQVNKAGATADVIIPFNEISEVHVRHKDA